jgi:hypothetical protein
MSAADMKALSKAGVLAREGGGEFERQPLPMRVSLDLIDLVALAVEFTIITRHDGGTATYRVVAASKDFAVFDLVSFDQGGSKP